MCEEQMHEECIEMIKSIFKAGEDVDWPIPVNIPDKDNNSVHLLGSLEGYNLQSHYEPKEYDNAEEVLTALIIVENLYGEQFPLPIVHGKLEDLS